uniref:PE-PGRS family protein n=1 Tax=Parastrongyloides trichosuri TaxID=131310 RepID=A0A0N4Z3U4_PARTI
MRLSPTTPPNARRVSRRSTSLPHQTASSIEKGPGETGAFSLSAHRRDGNGVIAFLRRAEAVGAERIGAGAQVLGDHGAGAAAAIVVGGQAVAVALRPFVQREVGVELRRIHANRDIAPAADVQHVAVVEGAVVGLTVAELQSALAAFTDRDRHDLSGRAQALAFRDAEAEGAGLPLAQGVGPDDPVSAVGDKTQLRVRAHVRAVVVRHRGLVAIRAGARHQEGVEVRRLHGHRIGLTRLGLHHIAAVVRPVVHTGVLAAEIAGHGLPRPDGALGRGGAGQNQGGREDRRHQQGAHGNLLGCDAKTQGAKMPSLFDWKQWNSSQLPNGELELFDDRLGRDGRRLDNARSHADDVGAQTDRLGRIHSVAHAARSDQQGVRQGVARFGQGARSGYAPVGEGQGVRLIRRIGRALALDQAPVGAARSGHIDANRAHGDQALSGDSGNPGPRLLDDDRRVQVADQRLKRRAHAPPVAISLRLASLLKRVQVNDQGVRANHVQRPACLVPAESACQLGCADIGQDRRIRRLQPQREVQPARRAAFQRRALRADRQGDAQMLSRLGQAGVDRLGARRPSGSRRPDQCVHGPGPAAPHARNASRRTRPTGRDARRRPAPRPGAGLSGPGSGPRRRRRQVRSGLPLRDQHIVAGRVGAEAAGAQHIGTVARSGPVQTSMSVGQAIVVLFQLEVVAVLLLTDLDHSVEAAGDQGEAQLLVRLGLEVIGVVVDAVVGEASPLAQPSAHRRANQQAARRRFGEDQTRVRSLTQTVVVAGDLAELLAVFAQLQIGVEIAGPHHGLDALPLGSAEDEGVIQASVIIGGVAVGQFALDRLAECDGRRRRRRCDLFDVQRVGALAAGEGARLDQVVAVLSQGVGQASVQVAGAVVVSRQAVVVGVEQLKIGVEAVRLHGDRHTLPSAAAEAIQVGRGAGIAGRAVRGQAAPRLLADRHRRSGRRRRPLLHRQAIIALGRAVIGGDADQIFARVRRRKYEARVQAGAAVVVLGHLQEGAVHDTADTQEAVEVLGLQIDLHPLARRCAEGVGVVTLAVVILGAAGAQAARLIAADGDAARPRHPRRGALLQRQLIVAGLDAGEGAGPHDVDPGFGRGEPQTRVQVARAVIVAGQRLPQGAFGVDFQIGVEIVRRHLGFQPLTGAQIHAVVVIAIAVAAARAGVAIFQPTADVIPQPGVGRRLGPGGAGGQEGDGAGRREQGITHKNLFAGFPADGAKYGCRTRPRLSDRRQGLLTDPGGARRSGRRPAGIRPRRQARPGRRHRRRRPRQPALCPQQGRDDAEGRDAVRHPPPARRNDSSRAAGPDRVAERRCGHPRHPGAAAPAQAHRFGRRSGRHLAGQGRGRLPRRQRRTPGRRPAGHDPLHAAGQPDAAEGSVGRSVRPERRHRRPLQHRRQADGATAAGRKLHRHHRPLAHPRPARPVPHGRHSGSRRRPPGDDQGRLDQAGRDRHRRGHQPRPLARSAGDAGTADRRPVGRRHPALASGSGDRGLRLSAGAPLGHRPEGERRRRPADRRAERAQGADRGRLWAGGRADRRLFLAHHPQRHPAGLSSGRLCGRDHRRDRLHHRATDRRSGRGPGAGGRSQEPRDRGDQAGAAGDHHPAGLRLHLLQHGRRGRGRRPRARRQGHRSGRSAHVGRNLLRRGSAGILLSRRQPGLGGRCGPAAAAGVAPVRLQRRLAGFRRRLGDRPCARRFSRDRARPGGLWAGAGGRLPRRLPAVADPGHAATSDARRPAPHARSPRRHAAVPGARPARHRGAHRRPDLRRPGRSSGRGGGRRGHPFLRQPRSLGRRRGRPDRRPAA